MSFIGRWKKSTWKQMTVTFKWPSATLPGLLGLQCTEFTRDLEKINWLLKLLRTFWMTKNRGSIFKLSNGLLHFARKFIPQFRRKVWNLMLETLCSCSVKCFLGISFFSSITNYSFSVLTPPFYCRRFRTNIVNVVSIGFFLRLHKNSYRDNSSCSTYVIRMTYDTINIENMKLLWRMVSMFILLCAYVDFSFPVLWLVHYQWYLFWVPLVWLTF